MEEEDIQQAIDECIEALDCGVVFSDWEQDFLQDIEDQYLENGTLSEKQMNILANLWDRAINE